MEMAVRLLLIKRVSGVRFGGAGECFACEACCNSSFPFNWAELGRKINYDQSDGFHVAIDCMQR